MSARVKDPARAVSDADQLKKYSAPIRGGVDDERRWPVHRRNEQVWSIIEVGEADLANSPSSKGPNPGPAISRSSANPAKKRQSPSAHEASRNKPPKTSTLGTKRMTMRQKGKRMHRPGIEPGAGRHRRSEDLEMATANFTTKPPMLFHVVSL